MLPPLKGQATFQVRGKSCIPRLMFAEGLLGPALRKVELVCNERDGWPDKFSTEIFIVGEERTQLDPRLGELQPNWLLVFNFQW